jgi:hypothetical protein
MQVSQFKDSMKLMTYVRMVVLLIAGSLYPTVASATPVVFTDRALFDAATAGLSGLNTLDFDSLPTGPLGSGPVQGISFAFNTGVFAPTVIDAFDTTSGPNSLGTSGDDTFLAGDSFTMSFASPTNAIGLYVIAATNLFANDFTLTTSSGGTAHNATDPETILPDTGKVFFLGLYDPAQAMTSATLTSNGVNADFLFNVDDIRGQFDPPGTTPTATPVPEPGSMILVATGLCAGLRRWRNARR